MKYFCQQGNRYTPQNKLQSSIQSSLGVLDGLIVQQPEEFKTHLIGVVNLLNAENPRCTACEVISWTNSSDGHSITFAVKKVVWNENHVVSFTLKPILGEFVTGKEVSHE